MIRVGISVTSDEKLLQDPRPPGMLLNIPKQKGLRLERKIARDKPLQGHH